MFGSSRGYGGDPSQGLVGRTLPPTPPPPLLCSYLKQVVAWETSSDVWFRLFQHRDQRLFSQSGDSSRVRKAFCCLTLARGSVV